MAVEPRPSAGLTIELLPARQGDAILVSWGSDDTRRHLLVDGGPASAYDAVSSRLAQIPGLRLELLVMTHIDTDHVEGSLMLANDAGLAVDIREVWFNGPGQLSEDLGKKEGEMFAALIEARDLPWNRRFDGKAVHADDGQPLPMFDLDGGLKLTVLGPDRIALAKLKANWVTECANEGLVYATGEAALAALQAKRYLTPDKVYLGGPAPPNVHDLAAQTTPADTSITNASSIVILAEHAGASVLLCGDATPAALGRALDRLLTARGVDQVRLGALKLPHHGSARNATHQIIRRIPAHQYLFCSSGGHHGRPHPQAVARCLEYGDPTAELVFNYRSSATLLWRPEKDTQAPGFRVRYPEDDTDGVFVIVPRAVAS